MTIAKVISSFGNQWSGGATSSALAYTTTDVDQNIILEISTENVTGGTPAVSSVVDTNGLTWAQRGSSQHGTATNGSLQDTEIWWAHAPTAVSGTITVTMTGTIDDGALAGIVLQGALTPSAPWDTNGALPALFSDVSGSGVTPSASLSTTNTHTLALVFQSSPYGASQSVTGGLTLNHSEFNHGGSNWENAFLASQFFSTAQTSTTLTLGNSQPNQFMIVDAIAVVGSPASGPLALDTTLKVNPLGISTSSAITSSLTTSQTPVVIVASFCLCDGSGPDITSVTDTAGLTWTLRKHLAVNDSGGGFQILDVWWAYAPNGVSADTITIHYTAQPVTAVATILAFSGSPSPATPWDANSSLPASASNATGTGSTPAVASVAVTASASLVLASQCTRQSTTTVPPTGFTDVGAVNDEPGGGSDRSYMDVGYLAESSAVSSTTFTSTSGSIAPWGMIVDALVGGPSSPTATWSSTEELDTMSAVGWSVSSGITGFFTPTELPDTMTAAGFVASVASWASVESQDVFSAFMVQPLRGVWASTEKLDTFAGTGVGYGESIIWNSTETPDTFAAAGIAIQPVIGTFNTSETPDRFRALGAGATRSTSPPIFFVT